MDRNRRTYIENIANAVLETLKENEIKLPTGHTLNEIIAFFKGRNEEIDSSLGSADGVIYKIKEKEKENKINFLIRVPSYQSETRKNFSIAHELGHLFLHMGYCTDWKKWESLDLNHTYERKGVGRLESEANEFAACFLMPKDKYQEIFDKHQSLIDVSEYFNVSIEAARNRGKWLGVIQW